MDSESLEAAAELCRLTGTADLLAWLELPRTATGDEARAALERARKRMQAMQANPKFKDAAKHLIKSWRKLDELLTDPAAYLKATEDGKANAQLPYLELAIDAVLADGALTPDEEVLIRDQATRLGFDDAGFEKVLQERARQKGISVEDLRANGLRPSTGPVTAVPQRIDKNLRAQHRTAGSTWWDEAFTRLLSSTVPADTRRVVDLACGPAWTAMALLPDRPALGWLGLDRAQSQVDMTRRNLKAHGLADRTEVQVQDPTRLALPSASEQVLVCVMAMHTFRDSRPVLAEAARVLRPGGRIVLIEPDSLAQQFWFDEALSGFQDLFQELCDRVDDALREASGVGSAIGQPGIAIGPQLGLRLASAGLDPAETVIHTIQSVQRATFPQFARRLRKRVEVMAETGGLDTSDGTLRSVLKAVDSLERDLDPERVGTCVHAMPLFCVTGVRPG